MAITLYTTPTCSFCKKAKKFFKDNRIPFREYDIAKDQRRADEMVRKSGQMGVPVIDIHGRVIVGFNEPEIAKALKR